MVCILIHQFMEAENDDYDYEYSPTCIELQDFFQYQNTSQPTSQVLVEDKLLTDPSLLAVYIQLFCEEDMIQEYDDKLIKSMKTSIYELKTGYCKDGIHSIAYGCHRDCERCWCEDRCGRALYLIKKFTQMTNNKNIQYPSQNDAIIALLEMSLATQHYFTDWINMSDSQLQYNKLTPEEIKEMQQKAKELESYVTSMKKRYDAWSLLTDKEKQENRDKVLKLIELCQKPFDEEEYKRDKERFNKYNEEVKKIWDEHNKELTEIDKRYNEERNKVREKYTVISQKVHDEYNK